MKIPYFLLLTACVANVYAGPPVLDSSTNSNSVPPVNVPAQTIPSYDQVTNLNKVQSDINDLKNKVQEQSNAIDYLQRVNADLQKRVADLGGGKVANAAPSFIASVPSVPASIGALADEKTRYNRTAAHRERAYRFVRFRAARFPRGTRGAGQGHQRGSPY